jgi:DNA-binding HxlR family transcriptional regulator
VAPGWYSRGRSLGIAMAIEWGRVNTVVALIGGRWELAVLAQLADDAPLWQAELQRRIGGVSLKVLSQTLKRMQDGDLITRVIIDPDRPATGTPGTGGPGADVAAGATSGTPRNGAASPGGNGRRGGPSGPGGAGGAGGPGRPASPNDSGVPNVPAVPAVGYMLTDAGWRLLPLLANLGNWLGDRRGSPGAGPPGNGPVLGR